MSSTVLVVSPCSGTKQFKAITGPEDVDLSTRSELMSEYSDSVASADEMYTGREHEHIQSAVQRLRKVANVDWHIISAGFGVLSSDTEIPSYECAFNEIGQVRNRAESMGLDVNAMTNNELVAAVASEKRIPQDLRKILAEGYDLAFIALGTQYLIAAQEALTSIPKATAALAFTTEGGKEFIGDCYWIPATEKERKHFGTTWLELRGRELLTLSRNIENEQHLGQIQRNPELARELSISI